MISHPTVTEEATYRKIAWRLIPLLVICYISAYVDRSNVAVAKLQFASEIGLSDAAYGLGGGLFYLGYSLFEIPSNVLLERIGARRTFFRILVLWSAISAGMAFMSSPLHFYLFRFFLGAAEAGFFPGVLLYISIWVPATRRARFTAMFMSAMALAGVLGNSVSSIILKHPPMLFSLKSWQWLFLLEGLPGILLAILALRLLPDAPDDARWLSGDEKALIAKDQQADSSSRTTSSTGSLRVAVLDPRFYALVTMSCALVAGIAGIALWTPTLLKNAGVQGASLIAAMTALPYIAALVVQQVWARHSDAHKERRLHAAIMALIAGAAWLLVPIAHAQPWLVLGCLTVAAAATFGVTGPFWAMPAEYLSKAAAARGIALITTCGGISAFISPAVVGALADRMHSLSVAPCFYGLLMMGAAVMLLVFIRRTNTSSD
jgi:sugar phosphate permease